MRAFTKTATVLVATILIGSNSALHAETQTQTQQPSGKTEVLDPNNYVGQVKAGYQAAKEIPDICAKLFCYCGCDMTDCHGSLLDCFTSDHGVDCHICQEEAILALKFHRKGKSLADIQKFIDKRYAKEYPFEVESATLLKYKKERLWDANKKGSASGDSQPSASVNGSDGKAEPKLKAGKKLDASCCGNDGKKN